MPENQIFNHVDAPNFFCEIETEYDRPLAPLLRVKLASTETFISLQFYAEPEMLRKLARLFLKSSDQAESKYRVFQKKIQNKI